MSLTLSVISFETSFAQRSGIGVDAITANFFDNEDYLQSYFGRGNFTYKGKYIMTVTVRADGSSRFGEDNLVVLDDSVHDLKRSNEFSVLQMLDPRHHDDCKGEDESRN